MNQTKRHVPRGGIFRRTLSFIMAFAMLLSLIPAQGLLKASAADGIQTQVTDLVQVKVGDTLTTMELYQNGVYEAAVPVSAGTQEAVLVVNGTETGMKADVTAAADGEVLLRVRDGVLQQAAKMPAALVGNFFGLEFVDDEDTRYDIGNWSPADANAELTYLGGGLYGRTFRFRALAADLPIADGGYKVAFNDNWDYSIGNGSDNIAVTVPAGSTSFTVLVDEINKTVYDSIRSGSFSVAQNNGALEKPALTTTVSFIGDARGLNDSGKDWDAGAKGYEFAQISDTLFRYQKTFAAGTYNYKCVFDYANWYEAEDGNRSFTLTERTHVVFLYDTVSGKLYDTVNNGNEVAEMLGMQVAPAEMKVVDHANGTTTFIATGEDGKNVTLFYFHRGEPAKTTAVSLGAIKNGSAESGAIFLGDEAQDVLYWYEIDGVRTLDSSNPIVSVDGTSYSNYTRAAFTGRLITVPGTLPGPSWDPAANAMTYEGNGRYIYTFADVAPANYEFKIATGSWSENYGLGGAIDGPNIPVTVPATQDVTIYYNDFSHRAVCSVDYVIAEAALTGTGIPAGTMLTDDYLIGIYSVTVPMEAGTYADVKITCNGEEYAFAQIVLTEAKEVTFYFDPITGIYYCNASDTPLDTGKIYFNSKDTAYKSVYGAVATGEEVTFGIDTGADATAVTLVLKGSNAGSWQMEKDGAAVNGVQHWKTTATFDKLGEDSYYFAITNGSTVKIYADDDGNYGEGTVTDLTNIKAYDLVVYRSGFQTPDWMKNAVVYQIFPDRFYDAAECNNFAQLTARGEVNYEYITDWYTLPENPEQEGLLTEEEYKATGAHWGDGEWSNEIYGGDLRGIIERIDYLKALGVNVIYLNPVFSSISSHRYDACDYRKIDPVLGTMGNFQELVKIAEANDMHIILDGVFNHVSDDSIYFDRYYKFLGTSEKIGAYPYWAYVYDYMAEHGAEQSAAETAAKEYFSKEYGITDYAYTEWFAVNNTPLIDADTGKDAVDNIGLRAGKTVYGYEGWWGYDSMPVILSTNGSEYQTGNWGKEIIYNEDGSSVTQYWLSEGMDGWRLDVANEVSDETWQEFRKSVKALNSDAVIIGEIWTDATKYLLGDMYDSVMNYMFRNAVTSFAMGGDASESTNTLERLRERYPKEAFYAMMNLVASHDTSRVLSYLDGVGDDRAQKDVDSAFPTYEKTSELAKQRQYLVAFLQFTYAGAPTIYYGDEIGMAGADDPDDRRGFTWGKGNKDIVTWYANLAAIRAQYPALRTGSVESFAVNENTMAFVRRDAKDAIVVLANNSSDAQEIVLKPADQNVTAKTLTDAVSGTTYTVGADGTIKVTVPALRGVILTETVKAVTVDTENLKPAYDPAYIVAKREANPTLTHNVVKLEGTPATCTEPGLSDGSYCADCGLVLQEQKTTPALGHDWDNGTITSQPTCTVDGVRTFRCTRCGETRTETIPATGHTVITDPAKPATCTESGLTAGSHCDVCGTVIEKQEEIAPLGHDWGEWEGTKEATEEEAGEETRTCKRCEEAETREIAKLDCPSEKFEDVDQSRWYHSAIDYALVNNLFSGVDDTHFAPNDVTTRAMFVAVLWRVEGKPAPKSAANFTDVPEKSYYTDAVAWAVENKIVAGKTSDRFAPKDNVTREQAASFLYRYAKYKGYDLSADADLSAYPDAGKVSNYAKRSVCWAVGNGLISGNKTGDVVNLDPAGFATRAQVARILMLFLETVAK